MKDIEHLLQKYDGFVLGEYESPEHHKERNDKKCLSTRLQLFEDLLTESKNIKLTDYEKDRVKYFIQTYEFKKLCNTCTDELIILFFIFYIKLISNPATRLKEWGICEKYGLTQLKYMLISSRLTEETLKKQPTKITPTTDYKHELLEKKGL